MKLKTLLSRSLFVAVGLLAGTSAWADEDTYTQVYTRTASTWDSKTDSTDWGGNASLTVDATNGLGASGSATFSATKTFGITDNAKVKYEVTWYFGSSTANNANFSYIQFGNIRFSWGNSYKLYLTTDGTSSTEGVNFFTGKNTTYSKKIVLVYNTATKTVESLSFDGTDLTSKVSGQIEGDFKTVTFGFIRGGRVNWGVPSRLTDITVSQAEQTVTSADYTINYKSGDNIVKTVTGTSVVDATIAAEIAIDGEGDYEGKHYLISDATAPTITLSNGTNTLDVPVRVPYTTTLTITTTINGTSTTADPITLTETDTKDCSWSYAYPKYAKSGDVYYACDATTYVISGTFTDGTPITRTVSYSTANNDIVSFEELGTGGTDASYSGGAYGASNSKLASATLDKGSYQAEIYIVSKAGSGSNTRNEKVVVGDETVGTTAKNVFGLQTIVFSVTADSTEAYVQGAGSSNWSDNLDYVLIRKIADPAVTINAKSGLSSYSNAAAVTVPDGVSIYVANAKPETGATTIELTKVTDTQVIPAGQGVLLYKAGGGAVTLTYGGTYTGTSYGSNVLTGTGSGAKTVGADETIYALVAGEQAIAKVDAGVEISANKAYLPLDAALAKLNIVFDGTVTGIGSVQTTNDANATNSANAIYNLSGQRVNSSYKGVVVKGGKKYINK